MIDPKLMLVLWIFLSLGLFMLRPPVQAFLLTYLVGLLVLPVDLAGAAGGGPGSWVLTQSLRLDRYSACHLGVFLGTLLMAPQVLRGYRLDRWELLLAALAAALALPSIYQGAGIKDGLSVAAGTLLMYGPILFFSKLYLRRPQELLLTLNYLLVAGLLYALIAVAEFRLSPQLHRLLYGYFPHEFLQFTRYAHFRPLGMLRHALEFAFFMTTTLLTAIGLWRAGFLRPLWGLLPGPVVMIWLGIGLLATLTFNGYATLLLGLAFLLLLQRGGSRWHLLCLPALAIGWMLGRFWGLLDLQPLIDNLQGLDATRAVSLSYRMASERLNLELLGDSWWLGLSPAGWAQRRLLTRGMAMDAFWLIQLVFFGLQGLTLWLLIWSQGIWVTFRSWGRLDRPTRQLAALISILLGIHLIDFLFNAFPSPLLLMLDVGLVQTLQSPALAGGDS